MDIIQAREQDIIEVLYLIKTSFEFNNSNQHTWRPPTPDYHSLKNEVEKGMLYLIKNNSITIGTFTLTNILPENFMEIDWEIENNPNLIIKRIAIAPSWLTDETGDKLMEFIEKYATSHNYPSVKLNVISDNATMNHFYVNMGFSLRGDQVIQEKENPYNFYEKTLKV